LAEADIFYYLCMRKEERQDDPPRRGTGEESPDRKGHSAGESPDGSNRMEAVTEKNRRNRPAPAGYACKGENVG